MSESSVNLQDKYYNHFKSYFEKNITVAIRCFNTKEKILALLQLCDDGIVADVSGGFVIPRQGKNTLTSSSH